MRQDTHVIGCNGFCFVNCVVTQVLQVQFAVSFTYAQQVSREHDVLGLVRPYLRPVYLRRDCSANEALMARKISDGFGAVIRRPFSRLTLRPSFLQERFELVDVDGLAYVRVETGL